MMARSWRVAKVSIGVASVVLGAWAISGLVEKKRAAAAGRGTAEGITQAVASSDADLFDEAKPKDKSAPEQDDYRPPPIVPAMSPEAAAVLAQVSATKPRPGFAASPPDLAITAPKAPTAATAPETQTGVVPPTPEKPAVVAAAAMPAAKAPVNALQDMKAKSKAAKAVSRLELPVSIQPLESDAPEVKQVRSVYERYLKSDGWWQKLRYVRNPGRVANLAHAYYEQQKLADPRTDKLVGTTRFDVGDESFVQLAYLSEGRWSQTARVNFLLTAHGEPQLDWESLVGFSAIPWSKFVATKPTTPTLMRGYVSIDDYFNYEFTDRERYLCVKITSPDSDQSVFGYCERLSPMADVLRNMTSQLTTMLLDGPLPITEFGPTVPITVELCFAKNAQSDRCVNIHRVLSNRWVLTETEVGDLETPEQ